MPNLSPPLSASFSVLLLSVLVGIGATGGCSEAPPKSRERLYPAPEAAFPASTDQRDTVLQILQAAKRTPLRNAFKHLGRYTYTRHTRTEQYDDEGTLKAFRARTVRHTPSGPEVLARDSSGTFEFGWLGPFVSPDQVSDEASEPEASEDLLRRVLPEEPAYRSKRSREAYHYELLEDTLLSGRPARGVEVRLRPDAEQALRRARLFVDRASDVLVSVEVERLKQAMLFDEKSRLSLRLRPAPDGNDAGEDWVPARTQFQTRIWMPLQATRHLRTTSTYAEYRR